MGCLSEVEVVTRAVEEHTHCVAEVERNNLEVVEQVVLVRERMVDVMEVVDDNYRAVLEMVVVDVDVVETDDGVAKDVDNNNLDVEYKCHRLTQLDEAYLTKYCCCHCWHVQGER